MGICGELLVWVPSGLYLNELIFKWNLRKEFVSEEGKGHAYLLTQCHESLMSSMERRKKIKEVFLLQALR